MNINHSYPLFLPPLSPDGSRIRPVNPGEWHLSADITFEEVAASLLINTRNTVSVNAIPDMWARPLFFEIVLRNQNHPLHQQTKAQWKGMISAIALAEVQGLKLVARLVDLGKLKSDFFISSLLKLIPSQERCLYQIDGGRNPWEITYIFLLYTQGQYQTVGMTSPSTIVYPSEDGSWSDLPWWSEENRILQSPIYPEDHLHKDEKIQLWLWLQKLLDTLTTQERYAGKVKEIIREFQTELLDNLKSEGYSIDFNSQSQNLQISSQNNYFNISIEGSRALEAINFPIAAKPMKSSVLLQCENHQREIIIIPSSAQDITKQWKKKAKDIWIYKTINLVSFNLEDFKKKHKDVELLTADELFLERFYFIKGTNNLPGATLPKGSDSLNYNIQDKEYSLTPLLPINSKLLEHFSPEKLVADIIEFQRTNLNNNQLGVRVILRLPLSGDEDEYVVTKDYPILEENAIAEIPFIEVWPNFIAPKWHEYYVFYFDARVDKIQKTFQVNFPPDIKVEIHPPDLRDFQITRLEEFPNFITCKSPTEDLGLILLKTPNKVGNEDPNLTWIVGVDFGTSFTNVYYKLERQPIRLRFSPEMHLQVTKPTKEAARIEALYQYFMPPGPQDLPLSTVLTTKGNQGQIKSIFDGRIYITGDINSFDPKDDRIYKTNLKWSISNTNYNKLFLKHLALLITAEAAKKDVKKIEWTISYPSAFSRNDKGRYISAWKDIIEHLEDKTGIGHQWLEKGKEYRSESLAIAHYFAEVEGKDLVYTTCIDMGGGTSDISIWLGNRLIHQCSILLAGNLLFSQFLKRKPGFLNEQFHVDISDLANWQREEPFYAKLDAILLGKSQKWLKERREILDENSDLRDVVQCSAIGIAGLYYYVGIVLKALHLEGKYNRTQITPVYIGGNGSRILNWLAVSGRFDEDCDAYRLFSKMLSIGSGFPDTEIAETLLSSQPKAEVACGLVSDQLQTKLIEPSQEADDEDLISGEDCEINGELIGTTSRIHLEGEIETFEVKELNNLKLFMDAFHNSLKELRISSIAPLPEYNNLNKREQLWKYVKRGVEADLLNMTGQADNIRMEPPFILGLKSLLRVLARR